MRNAVLGGGALGLTVALRLAQRGEEVVLFEKEPWPGGLAAGFRVGDAWLDKFYHHLFRSDTAVQQLITELGLGPKLVWPKPTTAILYQGQMHPFDSVPSVLSFTPLPFVDRLRVGMAVAYLKAERNYQRFEQITAAEWLRRWMGQRGYEIILRPLLQQKFGVLYGTISMAWMWSRFHLRSGSLGYLRGGFQQLYDALVAAIQAGGRGKVLLGQTVQRVQREGKGWQVVSAGAGDPHTYQFDRVISTLPTRLTCKLIPELPESFRQQYDWGLAYGAQCLILALDRKLLKTIYWLNVNDPGFPFLAVVEHTNYLPAEDYGGRYLIYLGNYLPVEDPRFSRSKEALLTEFLPHLTKINPAFDPSWVQESYLFRAPFAQPIVTLDFPRHIPPHELPLPNLYLANMFQVYPQDRGQNYSILMANRLVERLPKG